MSEQPKKRPWLQFHLSTAVVLMFVASGLLWLNMRWRLQIRLEVNSGATWLLRDCHSGWPLEVRHTDIVFWPELLAESVSVPEVERELGRLSSGEERAFNSSYDWDARGILVNVVVAALILGAITLLLEQLPVFLRRRKERP